MTKAFDRRELLKRLGCLTFSPLASVLAMDASQTTTDFGTVRADLLAVLEFGVPLQIEWHDMFDTLALCGSSPRAVSVALSAADIQKGIPALAACVRALTFDETHSLDGAVVIIRAPKNALSISRCKAIFGAATQAIEAANGQRAQMICGVALDETLLEDLRVTLVM